MLPLELSADQLLVETGWLDRPTRPPTYFVPHAIWTEGEWLRYAFADSGETTPRTVTAGPALLTDFVMLAAAPDDAIERYALRWGILELCRDGAPRYHNPPHDAVSSVGGHNGCLPNEWSFQASSDPPAFTGRELLYHWRGYAAAGMAMLKLAARFHDGERGQEHDWKAAQPDDWIDGDNVPIWGWTLQEQKNAFARQTAEWLRLGNVHPVVGWGTSGMSVSLGGGGLFGALAVQLLLAVARTDGLAICSACARPYIPARRPARGRRNYCGSCGVKASWRDAQRSRRERQAN